MTILNKNEAGQSLIEIIIALAIGALLIGAASMAIVVVLQSSSTSQVQQSATVLAQDIMEKARAFSLGSWDDLYGLTKGSSTLYYFYATSTQFAVLQGKEGVIANDIYNGLVGYWKLDEESGTTTYDYSNNGSDGTLQGSVTRATSTCKVGYCLDFDGIDDGVNAVDNSSIQNIFNSGGTIGLWINPRSDGEDSLGRIIYKTGWGIRVQDEASSNVRIDFFQSFSTTAGIWQTVVNIPLNTWTHVAITYNSSSTGNNPIIYIDGTARTVGNELTETQTPSGSASDDSGSNIIIGSQGGGARTFDGKIDDVRTYNRALSADEVLHLYNSTLFTRYFYVENVNRDTGGDIITSGGTEDPTTQKVTAVLQWDASQGTQEFTFFEYMTRWRNRVFHQSDWSGGSGQDGVIVVPNEKFASSTGLNTAAPGQFKIEGL